MTLSRFRNKFFQDKLRPHLRKPFYQSFEKNNERLFKNPDEKVCVWKIIESSDKPW